MIVCHGSDWHGDWLNLPAADLYVFTGDMLPNFPIIRVELDKFERSSERDWYPNVELVGEPKHMPYELEAVERHGGWIKKGRKIVPSREEDYQARWCQRKDFRSYLKNREAPVIVVDGNHDFVSLAKFIGGEVHAAGDPSDVFSIGGLNFCGVTGIPPYIGEWNYEIPPEDMEAKMMKVPDNVDVLLTHIPPHGVLDWSTMHLGCPKVRAYVERRSYDRPLKAHLFGHIHNMPGNCKPADTLFSNAATTWMTYEF